MKSVSSINIKEQKKVEEELRLLSQYAQDAIIQMNIDGLVTYWNKSAERLFGYTEKEMIGKNLHSILVPERYHKAYKIGFSKFKKSGQGAAINKTLELEGIRKDGVEFSVELSLSAVVIKNEWNSIGIIRDITKRKKVEDNLLRKTNELEERIKELNCLYNLSKLVENIDLSLEQIFQETVKILTTSFQFPEKTYSRIIFNQKEFKTENFAKTEFMIKKNLNVNRKIVGRIEVGYLEEIKDYDGELFIQEERDLTTSVSEILAMAIKRKNAEEKLKRTSETTKKLLDSLPIGIILVGYDKKIKSVNKVALKLLEMNDEFEILGKKCHHNMGVSEIGSCPLIDLGQKIDQSEKCLINKFGKEVPILKTVTPITLGDDNYLLEAFVDVSSLKEIEDKLKESQEKYLDLLETSSLGILDINVVNGSVEYLNPKLSELLGYSKEELIANNLFKKIMHREDIQKLFRARDDDGDLEFLIKTKDDERKWLACTKLSQYNKKGELIKLRLWLQDISERKKGEILKRLFTEQLEKKVQSRTKDLMEVLERQKLYLDQIEKSSRFKTEFMSTMSHELRTPLNAIIGFTDLLLESAFGGLNEEQLEFVKDIDESSNHLLEMITDILDISKIEAGQVILTVEEINVKNLVNQIISTLKPDTKEKELIFDLKGLKKEQFIFADRIKIKQIIHNLLSNAIKFTEKGKVIFEFRENKDIWEFIIKDTGIGIAEKDFNIIFKEFKRVKSAYVDSILGSGLGLALTKRIVNLHGGDIFFTSKLGKGTTFTFTIPKNIRNKANSEKKVENFLSKI